MTDDRSSPPSAVDNPSLHDPSNEAHEYLSTACFHGRHDYCKAQVNVQYGYRKTPAACKFCGARCGCACHDPAAEGLVDPGPMRTTLNQIVTDNT